MTGHPPSSPVAVVATGSRRPVKQSIVSPIYILYLQRQCRQTELKKRNVTTEQVTTTDTISLTLTQPPRTYIHTNLASLTIDN